MPFSAEIAGLREMIEPRHYLECRNGAILKTARGRGSTSADRSSVAIHRRRQASYGGQVRRRGERYGGQVLRRHQRYGGQGR